MIFCNRDVDTVRWFEDLDRSALLWDIFDKRSNVLVLVLFLFVSICLPGPAAGDPGEQWEGKLLFVPV